MWQRLKNFYHLGQALLAAIYCSFPSKKLTVIGVTGTDGKTTTVSMIYYILKSAGFGVSMISSVNAQIDQKIYDTGFHVTTPSPWQIQKLLKKAVAAGSKYFILEVTSHGLDQNRLAFVDFEIGVITNITHEHLDYHKTWENYAHAKAKLFRNTHYSILNKDDQSFNFLKSRAGGKIITYCLHKSADFNLKNFPLKLKIPGDYNLANALAAAAATSVLSIGKSQILKSLANFSGVKGRMEKVDLGQDFKVVIDFAHTPNGLEQALKTIRSQLTVDGSRIIAVFGAVGERDKSKRPLMGKVADELADQIVLTSEDPRGEDPDEIARQIASGLETKSEEKDYFIVTNRKDAIQFAINLAKAGDTVAIFGKGHEKSMTYGKKETPWDEFKAAENVIKRRLHEK